MGESALRWRGGFGVGDEMSSLDSMCYSFLATLCDSPAFLIEWRDGDHLVESQGINLCHSCPTTHSIPTQSLQLVGSHRLN